MKRILIALAGTFLSFTGSAQTITITNNTGCNAGFTIRAEDFNGTVGVSGITSIGPGASATYPLSFVGLNNGFWTTYRMVDLCPNSNTPSVGIPPQPISATLVLDPKCSPKCPKMTATWTTLPGGSGDVQLN